MERFNTNYLPPIYKTWLDFLHALGTAIKDKKYGGLYFAGPGSMIGIYHCCKKNENFEDADQYPNGLLKTICDTKFRDIFTFYPNEAESDISYNYDLNYLFKMANIPIPGTYEEKSFRFCECRGKNCKMKEQLESEGKKVFQLKDPTGCHLRIITP